jgi:hypothetical protein
VKNILTETEIYLCLKVWLREHAWRIIGGEPAGGTNDIPIIEIKNVEYESKGSKGSRKIDLVAFRDGYFLLIEVKATYAYSDIKKLNEIVAERKWRIAFLNALREKRVFELCDIPSVDEREYLDNASKYIKAVSFNYTGQLGPKDFVTFIASTQGIKALIGAKVSHAAEELLK